MCDTKTYRAISRLSGYAYARRVPSLPAASKGGRGQQETPVAPGLCKMCNVVRGRFMHFLQDVASRFGTEKRWSFEPAQQAECAPAEQAGERLERAPHRCHLDRSEGEKMRPQKLPRMDPLTLTCDPGNPVRRIVVIR